MSTLQSGNVYLSVSGDTISKDLVRATRGDDPDRLRQIQQATETGNELWRSWALANSGEILSMGGTELRLRVPTQKLNDVAQLRRRYADSIGSTVSIGFGTKLSEADRALEAAKKTGGDQILMYSPKIADLMQEPEEAIQKAESLKDIIEKTKQRSERMRHLALTTSGSAWKTQTGTVVVGMDPHDRTRWRATRLTETGEPNGHSVAPDHESALKIAYGDGADVMGEPVKSMKKGETGDIIALVKADDPGMNKPAAGGGMTAPQEPSPAETIAPMDEASEHSENEALREQMAVGGDVQNPADDIHAQLGQMATQQAQKDDQEAQQQQAEQEQAQGQDDMRSQVVKILKVFKDRSQELEGLQQQDPELYQSLTGMLQVMIEMSKAYFGNGQNEQDAQQVAKSEDLAKALPRNEAENQANAQAHQVAQDLIMEHGPGVADPHGRAGIRPLDSVDWNRAASQALDYQRTRNTSVRGNIAEPAVHSAKDFSTVVTPHGQKSYDSMARENDISFWREADLHSTPFKTPVEVTSRVAPHRVANDEIGHRVLDYSHHLQPEAAARGEKLYVFHPFDGPLEDPAFGMGAPWARHFGADGKPMADGNIIQSTGQTYSGSWRGERPAVSPEMDRALKEYSRWNQETEARRSISSSKLHQYGDQSSAAQIPSRQEMTDALGRSPVLKRKLKRASKVAKADLMPGGKGDNKPDTEFDHDQLAAGIRTEAKEHGLDLARAKEIAKDHLTEDPKYYSPVMKRKIKKAALDAGKTGRHQVNYPVGTQIDGSPSGAHDAGELKVRDPATGKTKWRSVRAGIVMAGDGTPTSSRNPGGE